MQKFREKKIHSMCVVQMTTQMTAALNFKTISRTRLYIMLKAGCKAKT